MFIARIPYPAALLIALCACTTHPGISAKPAPATANEYSGAADHYATSPTALAASRAWDDSVTLERVGFLQREASTTGAYFVTPEDIADIGPRTISDIFRRVPVLLEPPPGRKKPAIASCFVTYINGLPRFSGRLENLPFMRVEKVIAAEVYPPGQIPPSAFKRVDTSADCTTVALWMRS
jgi:hypothetical protein